MAKVSISSLVVVGAKEIIRSGKLYDESVDLPAVIKSAMDKAAAQAERSLCFMKAVSRSTLRANVKTIDPAKRDFKDKDEWKQVLKVLQEAGKLTYDAVNDSISLPA